VDIVLRGARLFDRLVVGVAESTSKTLLFNTEERVELFAEAVAKCKNVEVMRYRGLTVDFAHSIGANVLIRSMRAVTDFHEEFDMALMNRKMAPEIESVFLMSTLENLFVRGTLIREIASLGRDVSDLVPAHVAEALKRKLSELAHD
jgi:pantetheine-phosphate adenylyltransferase